MEGTENKEASSSSNKMLIPAVVVIAVLVLGAAGFLAMKKSRQNQSAPVQSVQTPSPTEMMMKKEPTSAMGTSATPSGQAMSDKSVKSFSVSGSNFSFSPSEIRVKKGDSVKVTFTSTGGTHDFVIDAYNVKTGILQNGQSETATFVADKAGTFEFYCSVGNHRAMGMVGKLVVE